MKLHAFFEPLAPQSLPCSYKLNALAFGTSRRVEA